MVPVFRNLDRSTAMPSGASLTKREWSLMVDRLTTRDDRGAAALHEDDLAKLHNKTGIPVPPDPEGDYKTDYTNLFLPTFPDTGEKRDPTATALMKKIMLPSDDFKALLARDAHFADVLAKSKHPGIQMTIPEQRHIVFLNGISAAIALVTQQHRVRGAVLGNLFRHVEGSVADCAAVLLAISLGTRAGAQASRQLLRVPGSRPLNLNARSMVALLSNQFADFKIYHRTLTALNPDIWAMTEIDRKSRVIAKGSEPGGAN